MAPVAPGCTAAELDCTPLYITLCFEFGEIMILTNISLLHTNISLLHKIIPRGQVQSSNIVILH